MTEEKKVPDLRFPGFTDPWEQRKLGTLSQRVIVGLATSVTQYYVLMMKISYTSMRTMQKAK